MAYARVIGCRVCLQRRGMRAGAALWRDDRGDHRVVAENELDDVQRDALRDFVRMSTVQQEAEVQK
jgi:hypothetical protein